MEYKKFNNFKFLYLIQTITTVPSTSTSVSCSTDACTNTMLSTPSSVDDNSNIQLLIVGASVGAGIFCLSVLLVILIIIIVICCKQSKPTDSANTSKAIMYM